MNMYSFMWIIFNMKLNWLWICFTHIQHPNTPIFYRCSTMFKAIS